MDRIKVIFLDVDGVLNSTYGIHTQIPDDGCMGVEEILKAKFLRLLSETDAKIVLCSTWRLYDKLVSHLSERLEWGSRYIGKTQEFPWKEKCPYEDPRQWEIEKWLDGHPEVSRWVCIDDSVYPVDRPDGLIINTDNRFGVTDGQIEEAVAFLNEQ